MTDVFDEFYNMLRATRDPIGAHFDAVFAFMDRPKRLGPPEPRSRRDTLASRRGKGMYPSPVGVAEFAGGETIRMSFWQRAGKPWRFDEIRRWLCQIIGNERGRATKSHAEAREDLRRKLKAARALMERPGSAGEGDAAKRAVERLEKKAMTEAFNAMSVWTRVYPPATDLVAFHVEHDGQRYNEQTVPTRDSKSQARAIKPQGAASMSIQTEPLNLAALMTEMETRLGSNFLDTKAWRRVRSRVKALTRIAA